MVVAQRSDSDQGGGYAANGNLLTSVDSVMGQ
jgi:hypothetical protein